MKAYVIVYIDGNEQEQRCIVYADSPVTAAFRAGVLVADEDRSIAIRVKDVIAARPLSERQWFEEAEASFRPVARMRGDIRD